MSPTRFSASSSRLLGFIGVLALGVGACGRSADRRADEVVEIPAAVSPYVDRFAQNAAAHGRPVTINNLIVRFAKLENAAERGICEIAGGETPMVTIDPEAWERIGEESRELLIHHELGHCVLHRRHRTAIGEQGDPASLMYPYAITAETFRRHETTYLQELFEAEAEF